MSAVATPLVVATRLAAPGNTRVWSASTESGARSSRTSLTSRASMPVGTGSPRPVSTATAACGSLDCFCQPTQVTGLAVVSTNCSRPRG
ncbi:hypothetical protein C1Y40_05541 [Mycobacterium talmoniae]|uniref:Uncharacterized protein n=1 Tax=Mycobacterium talmoniae TaxID=1858794 RepID=A0A2S8BCC0_9MYCO|nr:hypothetical protein C1Y40_05541 [Mycobacterium talmoniae]